MKKFMFYLMVLNTFLASIAMIAVLATGASSLPAVVLALRGALIVGAVALIVKKITSWVRRSEVAAFYLAEAAVTAFDLIFLSIFYPVNVAVWEFAITGTLITPVLNIALVLILRRFGNRYVVFPSEEKPDETGLVQLSGQAVKQN